MIRYVLALIGSLLLASPSVAATGPDAYRPVNAIRTFNDLLNGMRAQSLQEHRTFLKALAELEQLQPFPLLLDDGTEIFRVSTFKYRGQGDQYQLSFRTQPCVARNRLETSLSMLKTTSIHGDTWFEASTPYASYAISSANCLSSIALTEKIQATDVRLTYDGSVSAAQVETLIRDMEAERESDSPFVPIEKIWRSLGSTHSNGVKVLAATHRQPTPTSATTYSFNFSDEGCIDARPFADFMNVKDRRYNQTWTASVRPSRPECLERLTYISEPPKGRVLELVSPKSKPTK